MNIFVVDRDPVKAARAQCDKLVVAMPRESAQMLSTVARKSGLKIGLKSTHENHPCTLWAGESRENYEWLLTHAFALCNEFVRRYMNTHDCKKAIIACRDCAWLIRFPGTGLTPFAQVMPEKYRQKDAVRAYRAFYKGEKARFAKWAHCPPPKWWSAPNAGA